MIGSVEAVILLVSLVVCVAVAVVVIDVVRLPAEAWRTVGRSRLATLVLVVMVPPLGVAYHFLGRSPRKAV